MSTAYQQFRRALDYLKSQGYSTSRILRLAEQYGYRGFRNLAPERRGVWASRRGTSRQAQGVRNVSPTPASTHRQNVRGLKRGISIGQAAAGAATGNPGAVLAAAPSVIRGMKATDVNPIEPTDAELGPPLRIQPREADSYEAVRNTYPRDWNGFGHRRGWPIDAIVTAVTHRASNEFADTPAFFKALRLWAQWARVRPGELGLSEQQRGRIYQEIEDTLQKAAAHETLIGRYFLFWVMVTAGMAKYSADAWGSEVIGGTYDKGLWRGIVGNMREAYKDQQPAPRKPAGRLNEAWNRMWAAESERGGELIEPLGQQVDQLTRQIKMGPGSIGQDITNPWVSFSIRPGERISTYIAIAGSKVDRLKAASNKLIPAVRSLSKQFRDLGV